MISGLDPTMRCIIFSMTCILWCVLTSSGCGNSKMSFEEYAPERRVGGEAVLVSVGRFKSRKQVNLLFIRVENYYNSLLGRQRPCG